MLFASIFIYLVFSLFFFTRLFEKFSFSKVMLVFFLSTFLLNVLVSELLSLLKMLNHPWLYLGIQTLGCVILIIVIQRINPITRENLRSHFDFSNYHFSKLECFLLCLISVTFLGFFLVGISTPINNTDSLATHLPRIYYWLQHSSFEYWTTSNLSQLTYPINTLIQSLWLFLMGHSENLFFLVQWFSLIAITVSVFEISKSLGFSSTQALLSGLVGLSLPVVLLQVFSIQGDLTVTALIMVFITFLLHYYQTKKNINLWIACISIIAALGTKQTAFFVVPIAGLLILYLLILNKSLSKFMKSSWLLIIMVLVFASYQYIQNLIHTGTPFGMDSLLIENYSSASQVTQKALYVIPRFTYQFMGVDGLPRSIQPPLIQAKEKLYKMIFNPLDLDLEKEVFLQPGFDEGESFRYDAVPKLSEDIAWFGPLAFLLLPLATGFSLFSKEKLRRRYALLCLINSIVYLMFVFIQRPGWDPYQGRYFILSVFPFIPLISILLPKSKLFSKVVIILLVSASLWLIINTLLFNDSKPIITAKTRNVFINNIISPLPENNSSQLFLKKFLLKITYPTEYSSSKVNIFEADYYDQLFYADVSIADDIEFINQTIPNSESITFMIARNPLEYALFGPNRTRDLIPVTDSRDIRQGYFLANNAIAVPSDSRMKLVAKNGLYSIYYFEAE